MGSCNEDIGQLVDRVREIVDLSVPMVDADSAWLLCAPGLRSISLRGYRDMALQLLYTKVQDEYGVVLFHDLVLAEIDGKPLNITKIPYELVVPAEADFSGNDFSPYYSVHSEKGELRIKLKGASVDAEQLLIDRKLNYKNKRIKRIEDSLDDISYW